MKEKDAFLFFFPLSCSSIFLILLSTNSPTNSYNNMVIFLTFLTFCLISFFSPKIDNLIDWLIDIIEKMKKSRSPSQKEITASYNNFSHLHLFFFTDEESFREYLTRNLKPLATLSLFLIFSSITFRFTLALPSVLFHKVLSSFFVFSFYPSTFLYLKLFFRRQGFTPSKEEKKFDKYSMNDPRRLAGYAFSYKI